MLFFIAPSVRYFCSRISIRLLIAPLGAVFYGSVKMSSLRDSMFVGMVLFTKITSRRDFVGFCKIYWCFEFIRMLLLYLHWFEFFEELIEVLFLMSKLGMAVKCWIVLIWMFWLIYDWQHF